MGKKGGNGERKNEVESVGAGGVERPCRGERILPALDPLKGLGRLVLTAGLLLTGVGLVVLALSRFGFSWKLPGDILIQKRNFTFFFPIASMLLLSAVISLLLNLILRR